MPNSPVQSSSSHSTNIETQDQQRRWKIPLVLSVTFFIGYLDRMNISLALPLIAEEMNWSLEQKQDYGGLLMACFYMAYGISNLFLTPVCARIGPRKSLLVIIVLWSVFTSLGAMFSQFLLVFIASRIFLGFSEGAHVPMMNQLTKNWFPSHQRSRASGIWMGGLFLAILCGPIILVPIMHNFGWRAGFHLLAVAGLVMSLPLVYLFIQNKPEHAPVDDPSKAPPPHYNPDIQQSLSEIIKTPSYLAAQCTGVFNNMLAVGISSWMPTYLSSRADVAYEDLSYLNSIPYVFSLIGLMLWSWLGDKTNRRARNASIAFLIAGSTVFFSFNQPSLLITMTAFTAGVFFITAYSACEHPVVQHLFPPHLVAQGSGIFNGVAMIIGGGAGSILIGKMMADGSTDVSVWPLAVLFFAASISSFILHRMIKY